MKRGVVKIKSILAALRIRVHRRPFRVTLLPRGEELTPRLRELREVLPPSLRENVRLSRREPDSELFNLFRTCEGVHKWHGYFDIYAKEMEHLRNQPVRMLEIGVQQGGSLRFWKEWFSLDASIVGIDIDPSCAKHSEPERGIFVEVGDQKDQAFLAQVSENTVRLMLFSMTAAICQVK